MDWKTLLSNLIASLAWPTAILLVVVLLRREIGKLLGTLNRLKWKDFEAEFHQEIKELDAAAKRLPPVETGPAGAGEATAHEGSGETATIQELARISPHAALLTSWIKVEEAIVRTVNRLNISADPPWEVSPLKKIGLLQQWTTLDAPTAAVLHRLRKLRNQAAHASNEAVSLSRAEVMEYHEAATRAIAALDRVQYSPPGSGVGTSAIRDGEPEAKAPRAKV